MHLAIVSPYPPVITGIGQYGYHISRLLARSGQFSRISVLVPGPDRVLPPVAPHPVMDFHSTWRFNGLDAGYRIASDLHRLQPDLVWFNLGASIFGRSPLANFSGFLSPLWVRKLGFATVVTLHELVELADLRGLKSPGGALAPFGAHLLTRFALQADVVCVTMGHYVDWLAAYHGPRQYMHIPIGAYQTPQRLAENHAHELLFFTTLAPHKGLELLLGVFQKLQADYPDLHLTIAGSEHARFPGYFDELRQRFGRLENIRWRGQVPEDQVRDLFEQAAIVCIPYLASTGSSSVLFQAAAWGRAIVASDLSEARTAARECGLEVAFFQSGSPAGLEGALRRLLDAPALQQAQLTRNFAAMQKNRPEDICRAYLRAFNHALEKHHSDKRLAVPSGARRESA